MNDDIPDWLEPTDAERASGPRVNGWTFWEALDETANSGETIYLADFLRDPSARATITEAGWFAFAGHLQWLRKRSPGNPNIAPNVEVREAARRIYEAQECWRQQNVKYVPSTITDGFIDTEIKRIADQRGVAIPTESDEHAKLAESILNALSHKRF